MALKLDHHRRMVQQGLDPKGTVQQERDMAKGDLVLKAIELPGIAIINETAAKKLIEAVDRGEATMASGVSEAEPIVEEDKTFIDPEVVVAKAEHTFSATSPEEETTTVEITEETAKEMLKEPDVFDVDATVGIGGPNATSPTVQLNIETGEVTGLEEKQPEIAVAVRKPKKKVSVKKKSTVKKKKSTKK